MELGPGALGKIATCLRSSASGVSAVQLFATANAMRGEMRSYAVPTFACDLCQKYAECWWIITVATSKPSLLNYSDCDLQSPCTVVCIPLSLLTKNYSVNITEDVVGSTFGVYISVRWWKYFYLYMLWSTHSNNLHFKAAFRRSSSVLIYFCIGSTQYSCNIPLKILWIS